MLNIIGLAYRAKSLVYGLDSVSDVVNTKKARLILTACDANPKILEKAARMPERCNATYSESPFTSAQLGEALGVSTCTIVAFTDIGFAANLAEKLEQQNPETYGQLATTFREQKVRAKKRKEKKLRQR